MGLGTSSMSGRQSADGAVTTAHGLRESSADANGTFQESQNRTSLSVWPSRRSGHPDKDSRVSTTSSSFQHHQGFSNPMEYDFSGLHELPGKIDGFSAIMRNVQCTLDELQQDKSEKQSLQKELKGTQNKLQEATVTLEGAQEELKEIQDKLQNTTVTMEEIRKKWKKAVAELDQLRIQGSGISQVTDDDLVSAVKQLRYAIRNFSLECFTGKAPNQPSPPVGGFSTYLYQTTAEPDDCLNYLMSEISGPIVIQAFLWRLLVGEIFEHFLWTPRLRKIMAALYQELMPGNYENKVGQGPVTTLKAEQRFQAWKATTSALILDSTKNLNREEAESVETFYRNFCNQVLNAIRPFVRNSDKKILDDIRNIINNSVALDRMICKQAARIDWCFPRRKASVRFNPDHMAVEIGATAPQSGQYVDVVIAPALLKRGKSTGENFEMKNLLLKMEVACMPFSSEPDPGGQCVVEVDSNATSGSDPDWKGEE